MIHLIFRRTRRCMASRIAQLPLLRRMITTNVASAGGDEHVQILWCDLVYVYGDKLSTRSLDRQTGSKNK